MTRDLELDNGWVSDTNTSRRLRNAGYSVGGYIDKGVSRYVLYRIDRNDLGIGVYTRIHEFDSPEELNAMVRLLIPEEGD